MLIGVSPRSGQVALRSRHSRSFESHPPHDLTTTALTGPTASLAVGSASARNVDATTMLMARRPLFRMVTSPPSRPRLTFCTGAGSVGHRQPWAFNGLRSAFPGIGDRVVQELPIRCSPLVFGHAGDVDRLVVAAGVHRDGGAFVGVARDDAG